VRPIAFSALSSAAIPLASFPVALLNLWYILHNSEKGAEFVLEIPLVPAAKAEVET